MIELNNYIKAASNNMLDNMYMHQHTATQLRKNPQSVTLDINNYSAIIPNDATIIVANFQQKHTYYSIFITPYASSIKERDKNEEAYTLDNGSKVPSNDIATVRFSYGN